MQFSSIAFLIITETDEEFEKIEKYSYLFIRKLSTVGFSTEVRKVKGNCDDDVNEYVLDALKCKDIVITWGRWKNPRSWFYKKVSQVFEQNLIHSIKLEEYLNQNYIIHAVEDVNIPKHSKFLVSNIGDSSFPVIYLHRLYIIDEDVLFFKKDTLTSFLVSHLENYRRPHIFSKMYKVVKGLNLNEFVSKLLRFQNGLSVDVEGGDDAMNLKLCSNDLDELNSIQVDFFKSYKNFILKSDFSNENEDRIFTSDDDDIKAAVNCIEECFRNYGPENVFISFNGGKDCTVLLHMMAAILKKRYPNYNDPIYCMYVRSDNPFPQVDDFIQTMKDYYNLNIVTITSGIKEALLNILNNKPNLKACLMGTRRMDPFSANLEHFTKTDNGWPEVMRVSPLLDWDYVNIWDYLIDFKVPYCCLYDNGYTSLGNTNNTIKNPALKYIDEETNKELYLPAYKLFDGNLERKGREK